MSDLFSISIRSNVKAISKQLSDMALKQIRYGTALALTQLAKEVQADETDNIGRTFKKPKSFTKNAVGMRGARKDDLTAIVFVKPIAARYLRPYEDGGNHVLPGTALLNPKNIKLNANGQLPRGVLAKLKARPDVFIGKVQTKAGPVNGVWQRIPAAKKGAQTRRRVAAAINTAAHLRLIIRFGDAIPVQKSLHYRSRAASLINRRANAVLAESMSKAQLTSR